MMMMIASIVASLVAAVAAAPLTASLCAPKIDRFFVIVLENTEYQDAMRNTILGTRLTKYGRLLTNYKAITHPSQPNYIALISGGTHGVNDNKVHDIDASVPTIIDRLEAAGISWASYNENYPGGCFKESSAENGLYRRKHNPFISFNSIAANASRCVHVKSGADYMSDISANTLPSFVFYTPNMYNDGHDTDVDAAANWLRSFIASSMSSFEFDTTLVLITFDENDRVDPSNQVYSLLVGPGATPGTTDDTPYTHYSFLATIEAHWGLKALTDNDAAATPFKLE